MFDLKCRFLIVLLVFLVQFDLHQCGYRSRPSPSRPSPSRPSYHPSPSRPFPSHPTSRPFPSHATSRPFPSHPTSRPFPSHPTSRPFPSHPTSRPFPSHPTSRPFPSNPTSRPFPGPSYPTSRPFPGPSYPTSRPFPSPSRPFPSHPTPRPSHPTARPAPNPNYNSGGSWVGGGVSHQGTPPRVIQRPVHYPGQTKVKIYNVHNYHPSSYWAPPSYPIYHYSHRDTGSGALGFYLGYSLARLSQPTYYHRQTVFYDGYSPRYDHYTIHHYNHNNNVPARAVVQPNNIITCGGDSPNICPGNTTALCTSDGQIMCVSSAVNTIPCVDKPNVRCVRSTIPCANNDAPECKGTNQQTAIVNIPCVSEADVYGNLTTVNNTIVAQQVPTTPAPTVVASPTGPVNNIPITTMPTPINTFPAARAKRQAVAPAKYCVTVLAVPSVRQLTEGEQVLNEVSGVFEKFFVNAFGVANKQKT